MLGIRIVDTRERCGDPVCIEVSDLKGVDRESGRSDGDQERENVIRRICVEKWSARRSETKKNGKTYALR